MLMNLYPHFFTQYDQLLILQTQGLTEAELDKAQDIAATQVVEFLGSRSAPAHVSEGCVVNCSGIHET